MKRVLDRRVLSAYVGATIEEEDDGRKIVRLVPESMASMRRAGGGVILSQPALDVLRDMLKRHGLLP